MSRESWRIAPLAAALRARIAGNDRAVSESSRIESMMSLIDDALACLGPAVPAGTRLIVFGSRARGEARVDSDLDLLVVEQDVPDRFAETARLATLLGRRLIPADVVVMSVEAFERQKMVINTLAWRAAREGQAYDVAA
jgi:uncharacterized protein